MPATVARIRRRPESPAITADAKPVAKTPAKPRPASSKDASPSAKSLAALADKMDIVSHPTRLRVLFVLAEGERHVGALVDLLAISQPALSHHLALMRITGVVEPRRAGKNNFYALTDAGRALQSALAALVD